MSTTINNKSNCRFCTKCGWRIAVSPCPKCGGDVEYGDPRSHDFVGEDETTDLFDGFMQLIETGRLPG